MGKTKKGVETWFVKVPKTLDMAVNKAVEKDFHKSKAELIRSAVREKLERMGINKPEPETKKT